MNYNRVNKNNNPPFLVKKFSGVSPYNTRPNSYPYDFKVIPVGTMYCGNYVNSADRYPKTNVLHRDVPHIVGIKNYETLTKNLKLYETQFY